ncbi:MAG: efflux RND transporter periplasmic adaptor subunit [Ignavibacteriaceae bacterium]|jgi:RND family efflux transporter MFP subunit|nr:efflux RND transporter periplasmic adaptor subunit [Ignavibacteriaceae bacterium]
MDSKNADLSSLKIDRSNNNPKSSSKFVIYGIVLIIIIIAGYFIISSFTSSVIEVKLTTVVKQSPAKSNAILTASGYVVAQRKAAIASKGTGRLIYLGVVEGDKVKKDQVIGRLEDNDIRAQLEQAKANLLLQQADLNDAKNTFDRVKELFEKGLSSQQEYDQAEANYNRILASIEVANAGVQVAEVALENTLIRAPFDGTVLTKNAEVGEIVAPFGGSTTSKTAVVTIADMKSLLVETDVSESNIEKIKEGRECEITLDAYPEKSYQGYVFKIVPTADRSKATVLVKVGFKNYDSRVLPEMSAKVSFLSEKNNDEENQSPVITIPLSAVDELNGKKIVYVVNDNKAVQKEISTGRLLGNYVEVVSGLKEGDEIIDNLNDKIKDGVQVKVL